MNQAPFFNGWRRALAVLTTVAALALAACDGDVNINPVAPDFTPSPGPLGPRTLVISGMLVAEQGFCREATVLYDGRELTGARKACPGDQGCTELILDARTATASGRHTISFKVLRQSRGPVTYLARGRVQVSRGGFAGVVDMLLEPSRATLRPGQSVDFEIEFTD